MSVFAGRSRRRILEGALLASVLSGAPSTTWALAHSSPREARDAGLDATRAIATLLPSALRVPRRGYAGLLVGGALHLGISLAVAEALGAVLPARRSVGWGALAGVGVGVVNLGFVARRWCPELAALALGPQLADHAAFGAVFAAVADR